ncbi:MAG: HAD family hydrolase [Ruminococcus sp.]|nr:HAD family hydrolase [Ruminococcus sp.]
MYKAIIFDLDGTLVDTLYDLADAVNEGLRRAGLPTHDTDEYRYLVGNGRDKLVQRAMGECRDEDKANIVRDTFDSYYAEHCNDNVRAYDGCAEMLTKLNALGIKTAVLSNKPDEFVERILSNVYPDHSFTAAWGKRSQYPTKPNPTALIALMNELGVAPDDCLYIGDSDVDVYTARNAEVDMLGVDWGFRGREELLGAGADKVVSSAAEILEYIDE